MSEFSPANALEGTIGDSYYDSEESFSADGSEYSEESFDNEGSALSDDEEEYDEESVGEQMPVASAAQEVAAPAAEANSLTERIAAALESVEALQGAKAPLRVTKEESDLGIKSIDVKFYFESSLADCAKKDAENRAKIIGNAEKIFGAKKIVISAIELLEVDNRFPVSLSLNANHLTGQKICKKPTVTGTMAMFDAKRNTHKEIEGGLLVYKSTENDFSRQFSSKFPGYTVDNLGEDIRNHRDGNCLIPKDHPVIMTIADAREENGQKITPDMFITALAEYRVSQEETLRALNTLRNALQVSNEQTNVNEIYFDLARSNLTSASVESLGSEQAGSPWTDSAQIEVSAKTGQSRESEFAKKKSVEVTARLTFRPTA